MKKILAFVLALCLLFSRLQERLISVSSDGFALQEISRSRMMQPSDSVVSI
mgnify:CR=1 FL=1